MRRDAIVLPRDSKEILNSAMVSKSHKGHSGNFPTTSERSLWRSSPVARAEPRWRVTRVDLLSGAIIVAIAALALFGCSSSKEEDDTAHAANHSIARLSPEQCAAGAQIQAAGDLSGPEGSYLIQPGDQLSLEFYL